MILKYFLILIRISYITFNFPNFNYIEKKNNNNNKNEKREEEEDEENKKQTWKLLHQMKTTK